MSRVGHCKAPPRRSAAKSRRRGGTARHLLGRNFDGARPLTRVENVGVGEMNAGDGSMTFDWIFFAIVAIPMAFAAWELYKTPKGL